MRPRPGRPWPAARQHHQRARHGQGTQPAATFCSGASPY
jgi:hypothetical protein